MDSDSYPKRCKNKEKDKNRCSCSRNVLQPSWIRCPISSSDELDGIILDYGCNFLWRIGIVLWVVFFTIKGYEYFMY